MRPTDRGPTDRADLSDIARWVDVARHGKPDDAETRRARMLCASHRDAKLESTLMADFDAARAARDVDGAAIDAAVGAVMRARSRTGGDRPSAPVAIEGPRVANAIATPGPQQAVRFDDVRPSRPRVASAARVMATLVAGVALGAALTVVALGSELGLIVQDADAPIAAAVQAPAPMREPPAPVRDPRMEAIDAARAVLGDARAAAGAHPSARRLAFARRLVDRGELERATRVLRVVSRRWPRRAEASEATLALAHLSVALERPRTAEGAFARWLRGHERDERAAEVRRAIDLLAAGQPPRQ
jgi:hypothetical protein